MLSESDYRFVAFTYDGLKATSYLDGFADDYPTYTDDNSNTYSKNPYLFGDGLNRNNIAEFTVGAVKLTGGISNFFKGGIGGLAIFDRALTAQEIAKIHIQSLPSNGLITRFHFSIIQGGPSTEEIGWRAALGASATLTPSNTSGNFIPGLISGNGFIFRNGSVAANLSNIGMGYFDKITGIRASQIAEATFLLNNSRAADTIKFCIKIDDVWYASNTDYSVTGDGRTGGDWSTAEQKTVTITRAANTWRALTLTPGSSLALGALIGTVIPNGELTGVGFYSPALAESGSIVRIGDLSLYAKLP
jgi:hypothetical protein